MCRMAEMQLFVKKKGCIFRMIANKDSMLMSEWPLPL